MDCPPEATSLLHHVAAPRDPRQPVKVIYPLLEILLLILCASIATADNFVEVQHWVPESEPVARANVSGADASDLFHRPHN